MLRELRHCWFNCFAPDDSRFQADEELAAIDAMEEALSPLDETTIRFREWITRFEACYVEADREVKAIVRAIGQGLCPEPSQERPARRREELANSAWVLSAWCEDPEVSGLPTQVGDWEADDLLALLGEPTPLKLWQVERVVEHIRQGLDPNRSYHPLALDPHHAEKHYGDALDFLHQTQKLRISDTLNGEPAQVSLAFAIDLLMPCHWDFLGSLVVLLKAIGGDLYPETPYTCCARNLHLNPLCESLRTIAATLRRFGSDHELDKENCPELLKALGTPTPEKQWLIASLEKTIRLQLEIPFTTPLV